MPPTFTPPKTEPFVSSISPLAMAEINRDEKRKKDAHTHYPMPSTYLFLPFITALLPAAPVVWFPGVLSASFTVTVLVFVVALYITRRVFAIKYPPGLGATPWENMSWRMPTTGDLTLTTLCLMALLAATSTGYIASVVVFTALTWAWVTIRGYLVIKRGNLRGTTLLKSIWAQWKKRDEEYRRH